ncbi:MAG: hypothetical protein ACE5IO_10265, partial [Thermoplasmata archaeon]
EFYLALQIELVYYPWVLVPDKDFRGRLCYASGFSMTGVTDQSHVMEFFVTNAKDRYSFRAHMRMRVEIDS